MLGEHLPVSRRCMHVKGHPESRGSNVRPLLRVPARDLPLGCPLSPLLGAFFLGELDERLEANGLFYVRYMDDVLVLAPTRHSLTARWRYRARCLASF